MKPKSMKHVLSVLNKCDVILKNGQKQFIGLYYDAKDMKWPIVLFKCDWRFNYFLSKALDLMNVLCVEHKSLTSGLFVDTNEGEFININYAKVIAEIYKTLPRYKKSDEETFDDLLDFDIEKQLYQLEADICKRANKNYFQNHIKSKNIQITDDEAVTLFHKSIPHIAEKNNLDYKIIHNVSNGTDEYYLESVAGENGFDVWLMIMVSAQDRKIYVGNRAVFNCFELNEAEDSIDYIKMMIQTFTEKLLQEIKTFYKEFEINPRLYEIANNSIKTILESNYDQTGIEYGFNDSMKTHFNVYLKNPADPTKMYDICITYNEFLRNPNDFQKLIESPKILKNWNFWSRQKKYKKEFFEERF